MLQIEFKLILFLVFSICQYSMTANAEDKPKEMKPYTVKLKDTKVKFEMLPIPGGVFMMGSPKNELARLKDEGPQFKVRVEPFWMGKYEVTWNEYNVFKNCMDFQFRFNTSKFLDRTKMIKEKSDAVSRPTREYTDMSYGMGVDGFPVVNITQFAAKMYCEFLSAKTGHYYRLPTEAEWEYACRAGTTTAFSWGDDYKKVGEYAWYYENSGEQYHQVGTKKPNPWGLHDMHGNVAEWCLDQYVPDFYKRFENQKKAAVFPVTVPTKVYHRIFRGGSWDDDAERVRSAAREKSEKYFKAQDVEVAKSMWWNTDSSFVGFRVIRPLKRPSDEEIKKYALHPVPPKEQMTDTVLEIKCK